MAISSCIYFHDYDMAETDRSLCQIFLFRPAESIIQRTGGAEQAYLGPYVISFMMLCLKKTAAVRRVLIKSFDSILIWVSVAQSILSVSSQNDLVRHPV